MENTTNTNNTTPFELNSEAGKLARAAVNAAKQAANSACKASVKLTEALKAFLYAEPSDSEACLVLKAVWEEVQTSPLLPAYEKWANKMGFAFVSGTSAIRRSPKSLDAKWREAKADVPSMDVLQSKMGAERAAKRQAAALKREEQAAETAELTAAQILAALFERDMKSLKKLPKSGSTNEAQILLKEIMEHLDAPANPKDSK